MVKVSVCHLVQKASKDKQTHWEGRLCAQARGCAVT